MNYRNRENTPCYRFSLLDIIIIIIIIKYESTLLINK